MACGGLALLVLPSVTAERGHSMTLWVAVPRAPTASLAREIDGDELVAVSSASVVHPAVPAVACSLQLDRS